MTDNIIPLPPKIDGALALAKQCWEIYSAFRDVGFGEAQAMELMHRVLDGSWGE